MKEHGNDRAWITILATAAVGFIVALMSTLMPVHAHVKTVAGYGSMR